MKAPVASAPAASPEAATLARRLGPYDAATIVISNVVGGGIFFIPVMVARARAERLGDAERLARRRRARVRGRDGLRGARDAAAARGRRIRLPARGVRPARRVSHRLDVVRRRILRRDRRGHRRARRVPRPVRPRGRRQDAARDAAAAVPAAGRDAAGARRDWRDLHALDRAPARLGTLRPQHPRGREGPRDHDVHRARAVDRPRVVRAARDRPRRPRADHRLAARARAGDVRLLGVERRDVRRRGDSRSGPQPAALARRSARWPWSSSISR